MSLLIQRTAQIFKVGALVIIKVIPAVLFAPLKLPGTIVSFVALHTWDLGLFLGNLLTPQLKKGNVVKPGVKGHGGLWPAYVKPNPKTDSRSPCPYLNAMANHGILPHDGKNIKLKALGDAMVASFNFSPSLVKDTVNSVSGLYGRDHIDLGDLAAHNLVEHDASLIRHDAYWEEDQVTPAHDLIDEMLAGASGPKSPEHPEGYLTPDDISRALSLREARSKRDNPVFKLDLPHVFFSVSNGTLMLEVENDVKTLRTILHEERLPDGFESKLRQRFGYTMKEFHLRSAEIILGKKTVTLPKDDIKTADAIAEARTKPYYY